MGPFQPIRFLNLLPLSHMFGQSMAAFIPAMIAGEVVVVGVAGDEIPVHKPRGKTLIPYTLWGEMAFQVGGKKLYSEV